MIKWNGFDTDCKMNELFSSAGLASYVLYEWSPIKYYEDALGLLFQLVKSDGIQGFQFGNQKKKTGYQCQATRVRRACEIRF